MIIRGAIYIGLISLVVKAGGFIKEMAVARSFGTGTELDVFLLAFLAPTFFAGAVGNSFHSSLVPVFARAKTSDNKQALDSLISNALLLSLALSTAASLTFLTFSDFFLPLLAPGFDPQQRALATQMLPFLFIYTLCYSLSGVLGSVLIAKQQASYPTLTPLCLTVSVLLFLLSDCCSTPIFALVYGTTCGALLELILLSTILAAQGRWHYPAYSPECEYSKELLSQYWPILMGAALLSVPLMTDFMLATWLPDGSLARLNFGMRIPQALSSLLTVALSMTLLPAFRTAFAETNIERFNLLCKKSILSVLLLALPCVLILYLFSNEVIQLAFERGQFNTADTSAVGLVQATFCFNIPVYTLMIVLSRAISAQQRNVIILRGNILAVLCNILFDLLLMGPFGIAGIAFATVIAHTAQAAYLSIELKRGLRR